MATDQMGLKPMFCLFGGKWRAAPRYPQPTFDSIIEPFAGGAGYALRYFERQVTLYEADSELYEVWRYLQSATPSDIRRLPIDIVGSVDDLDIEPAARTLIALWVNKGGTTAKKSPSAWHRSGIRPNSYWGEVIRERIASQVSLIRHWKIHNQSYETAPDIEATWFIDPPYEGPPGRLYRHKISDYQTLGQWCQTRRGQVIVCEREGAQWLPFLPFRVVKATPGSRGKSYSSEVIWMNGETGA